MTDTSSKIKRRMAMSNLHIKPIAPDPSASRRYGSPDERSRRDQPSREESHASASDRLEISRAARETFLSRVSEPDLDFARKALAKAPPLPDSRITQIFDRIEGEYYAAPGVLANVAIRVMAELR